MKYIIEGDYQMENQDLGLFNKGTFSPIDNDFMTEGYAVLQQVKKVQEKYEKEDTDTFINELRDSITGYTLGFNLVNIDKHGFDCKMSENEDIYLEVKSASFSASSWQATFNDTTLEKASAFKDKKVYLALSVWRDSSDLLFICFGQNEGIGEYLEEKVNWFKGGNTVRSTQSIPLSKLVFKYGFKILAVGANKKEVCRILRLKNRSFFALNEDDILSLEEYRGVGSLVCN